MTIDFFDNFIKTGVYETYISDVVIAEIQDTKNSDQRNKLLKVIEDYPVELLDFNETQQEEIAELATKYVQAGIIPAKKKPDALHIATSVVFRINYLVSWNYRHLANINKEQRVRLLNWENNYRHELRIITPLELIDYGD